MSRAAIAVGALTLAVVATAVGLSWQRTQRAAALDAELKASAAEYERTRPRAPAAPVSAWQAEQDRSEAVHRACVAAMRQRWPELVPKPGQVDAKVYGGRYVEIVYPVQLADSFIERTVGSIRCTKSGDEPPRIEKIRE